MSIISDILSISKKLSLYNANEAETRLKIIDKILFEILELNKISTDVSETSVTERISSGLAAALAFGSRFKLANTSEIKSSKKN